jgi:very-short-patch-repair endonuclease
MRKEVANRRPDATIAGVAGRQHGVVTAAQLAAAGISPAGVDRRVAAGRLYRIHRGVYAVGHPNLSQEGRWMAAVLACGGGAVLSHRSAAALWGVRRRAARSSFGDEEAVDVTVSGDGGRAKRAGIRVHRSATLQADDCTRRMRIPVTTPARTLADLRRFIPQPQFAAALREAEFLGLRLDDRVEADHTRSELEGSFLSLCRRHRLPKPAVNARLDRYAVDFLWPAQRLIVEVDGWQAHRTRSAFEMDRARDARLKLLGYEVLRFTWRQVKSDRQGVARTIRGLLRRLS